MTQNELLPGCAVLYNGKECIYSQELHPIRGYFRPIPLTAESVANVEGSINISEDPEDPFGLVNFEFEDGNIQVSIGLPYNEVYLVNEDDDCLWSCKHITSIHQLQILIYSLTGTMPKYEIG